MTQTSVKSGFNAHWASANSYSFNSKLIVSAPAATAANNAGATPLFGL